MSNQVSKKTGDLWAAMVFCVEENELIGGFANFGALVLAQMYAKLQESFPESEDYTKLQADYRKLERFTNISDISLGRDMTMAQPNYARIVTTIYTRMTEIMKIAVHHKLIEFSDGSRFGSYGGAVE